MISGGRALQAYRRATAKALKRLRKHLRCSNKDKKISVAGNEKMRSEN